MIAGIEMFLGVDGKQVGMKMTEYQMAANSIGVTSRLEMLFIISLCRLTVYCIDPSNIQIYDLNHFVCNKIFASPCPKFIVTVYLRSCSQVLVRPLETNVLAT